MFNNKNFRYRILIVLCLSFFIQICAYVNFYLNPVDACSYMPFYDLKPQNLVLRSQFYTTFTSSTPERKNNIKIASLALNKYFIDVGGEFSFNRAVGPRTEQKGYKTSKIISNGQFVDGIGGGVCQVSTTLYNAVLLAGLKVIEYHPHSLPVSYVSPSFDAMVSYGGADLKFINDTKNPILIYTYVTDNTLRIEIYGEPCAKKYYRKSVVVCELPAPEEEVIFDIDGEYPDLYLGEQKTIRYSHTGLKSEGYIMTVLNGITLDCKKIRSDTYNPTRGLIVHGSAIPPTETNLQKNLMVK